MGTHLSSLKSNLQKYTMSRQKNHTLLDSARQNFQEVLSKNIQTVADEETKLRENYILQTSNKRIKRSNSQRKKVAKFEDVPDKSVYPYAVSLFDRYIDVSKFNKNTNIREMTRAWVKNDLGDHVDYRINSGNTKNGNDEKPGCSKLNGPLNDHSFLTLQEFLNSTVPEREITYIPNYPDLNLWKHRWKMVHKTHVEKSLQKMDAYSSD